MIRRGLDSGDLLISQAMHAAHAGRLALLLRDLPEPRDALLRAVALHDAGWPLIDESPEPLADGRPPHVFDHPAGATTDAWRRSIAIARTSGCFEGLLVSRHFSAFSASFARDQAEQQAVWSIGVDPAAAAAGLAVLQFCDSLSLHLLCGPEGGVGLPAGFRLEGGALRPWPFACERIEDAVPGRLIPRRLWASAEELQSACQAARWAYLPVSLSHG
ncbi:MAG: DUF3891 family protein [Planctomycetaceae bacterium]